MRQYLEFVCFLLALFVFNASVFQLKWAIEAEDAVLFERCVQINSRAQQPINLSCKDSIGFDLQHDVLTAPFIDERAREQMLKVLQEHKIVSPKGLQLRVSWLFFGFVFAVFA